MTGLIELLGGGLSQGSTNTWTAKQTFAGDVAINRQLTIKGQAIALNGGAQTVDLTAGSTVRVTGATGSSSVKLPAAPAVDQVLFLADEATGAWTLDGNGKNIDGAATQAMTGGYRRMIYYNGTQWDSMSLSKIQADALYGALGGANTWTLAQTFSSTISATSGGTLGGTFSGTTTFSGAITFSSTVAFSSGATFSGQTKLSAQSFATNAGTIGTISGTGAPWIEISGTTGGTINLPTAAIGSSQIFIIKDAGGNAGTSNITVSGNGNNIDGASTKVISANYGALRLRWNGTIWETW